MEIVEDPANIYDGELWNNFLTTLLIIVAKLSILDVCGATDYTSWNSATGKNCNMWRVQQEKNAKRKHRNV